MNTPNAENVVFIEFKSIKRKGNADKETAPVEKVDNETDDSEPVVNGVDGKGIDVEQLLGYLADPRTVSLNSLRYVLNAKKMDPDNPTNATNLARKKMQLVFKNNATLIYNARPALFNNIEISTNNFIDSPAKLKLFASDANLSNDFFTKVLFFVITN